MFRRTLTAAAALLCLGAAARAEDPIRIRVADAFPATHVISAQGAKFWMDRVTALTGGKVVFEYYPAQQLGKAPDFLRLLQSGVADVAYVAPGYVTDKMPLSDVAMLPGMFSGVCKGAQAYWTLATTGVLAAAEFKPNGIMPIFASVLPPYQIVSPRRPVNGLSDLEGLKIRSGGGSNDLTIRMLGGVPVKIAGPETREGLDRGTIDANLGPHSSLKAYDIYPFARYGTVDAPLGSFVVTYSMLARKWTALPEPIRAAFRQAGDETNAHLCQALEDENTEAVSDMRKLGARFYTVSEADRARLRDGAAQVDNDWARALEARGKPAQQALAEFRKALGQ